jgi:hypothetical protein
MTREKKVQTDNPFPEIPADDLIRMAREAAKSQIEAENTPAPKAPRKGGRPPKNTVADIIAKAEVLSPKEFFARETEKVKTELAGLYDQRITDLITISKDLVITDEASLTSCVDMTRAMDLLTKEIEKRRKEIVESPNAYVKGINSIAKFFTEKTTGAIEGLKTKITEYNRKIYLEEQERIKKAKEEEAARLKKEQEEYDKARAKIQEADPQAIILPPPPPPIIEVNLSEPAKTTRTLSGNATLVAKWEFEVDNIAEVPREYLQINEAAIKAAIKGGIRSIPGVKIFENFSTRISG